MAPGEEVSSDTEIYMTHNEVGPEYETVSPYRACCAVQLRMQRPRNVSCPLSLADSSK